MSELKKAGAELIAKMDAITHNKGMDWQAKRAAAEVLELNSFLYASEEAKKSRFRLMAACRNPQDLGKDGKMMEAGLRLIRSLATGRALNNAAFYAHSSGIDDTRINVGGKQIRTEIKSGSGDWYRTNGNTVAEALEEYKQENKLLIWKTPAFTIVLPFHEFIDELENYNEKGAEQFFKSSLKVSQNGNTLQLQEWKTSKKKIRFLQSIARRSYNLSALLMRSELVRRG